jgi:hypothetical protein
MSVLMRSFSLWFQQSPEEQESITLADLEVIKVVGVGSSGKVEKVRHKRTHKIYALKVNFSENLFLGIQRWLVNSGYQEPSPKPVVEGL